MARSYNPALASWQGKRGTVKKQIVYRNRGGITFVSKYPEMSNVRLSSCCFPLIINASTMTIVEALSLKLCL
jgi:hypothetical protein